MRKVPKDDRGRPMHWVLIGKGGCNARRIREETGAELIVPPPQSYSDEYSLRGSLEATEKAARIIFELLSEIGEVLSFCVNVFAGAADPTGWFSGVCVNVGACCWLVFKSSFSLVLHVAEPRHARAKPGMNFFGSTHCCCLGRLGRVCLGTSPLVCLFEMPFLSEVRKGGSAPCLNPVP